MEEPQSPSNALDGHQRKYLRGLAHNLEPAVQVGVSGVTIGVINQVEATLSSHELVKVRMREPEDKKAMAADLAARTHSILCGLVGHTVILYRRDPEEPRIELPKRRQTDSKTDS